MIDDKYFQVGEKQYRDNFLLHHHEDRTVYPKIRFDESNYLFVDLVDLTKNTAIISLPIECGN